MKKDFNELVDFYYKKKKEGMDFSQIRKELQSKNVEEPIIKEIMNEIDTRILKGESFKFGKLKARELRLIGWTLMIIGGGITLGTYLHWFDVKGFYIVTYGPVIAGYLMLIAARKATRKAQ